MNSFLLWYYCHINLSATEHKWNQIFKILMFPYAVQTKFTYCKNISKFRENWSVFAWFTAQTNIQTNEILNCRMSNKINNSTKVKKKKFQKYNVHIRIVHVQITVFVQKLSRNKRIACTNIWQKIIKKLFLKILDRFLKKSLRSLLKNPL